MDNNNIPFGCTVTPSNPAAALGIKIILNDQVLYENSHVSETINFVGSMSDADGDHVLKLVLFGKTPEMTKIDHQGNILEDATLTISDIMLDEININIIVNELSVYEHDFNGSKSLTQEKFYGTMGCNGTVSLRFSTPIYLWLLENM